jgi:hypothetical protein
MLNGNIGLIRNQPLSLFNELKRRNVFKVAVAHIVIALLIIWADESLAAEPVVILASQTS